MFSKFVSSPIRLGYAFLSCALVATVACNPKSQAAEPTEEGLLFYAPYDNGVNAAVGANLTPLGQKGALETVEGKKNGALRTGAKDSFLMYDGSNLNANEGTLSLWIRPEWAMDKENFHMFWSVLTEGNFTLYKHGSGKSLVFLMKGKGATEDQATLLQTSMADWNKGEWHHVAATWSSGSLQLFVDGELKKEMNSPELTFPVMSAGTKFFVGDYYHESYGTQSGLSGQPDSDIDELRIYDHALSTAEIRALAGKEATQVATMKTPQTAKVVVPKTAAPPKIDGAFSLDEWRDAAGFSGFFDITTGKLTERQTGVLLTYDDNNLYMATIAPLVGGTPLQTTISARDGAVYNDDSIEIYLDPTKSRKAGNFYQFIGNYNGAILDVKSGDNNWSGNWQFKNTLNNLNGLGVNYWVTEIAIPFKDLDRQTPKNGEEWTANFARNWVAGQQVNTSWAWLHKQQYSTADKFGTLEFQDKAPAFQWTDIRDLTTGQPILAGTFKSATDAKLQISSLSTAVPTTDKELKAATQKAQPWTTTLDLAGAASDTLHLEVRDGDRVLYASDMPYQMETKPLRVFVSPLPTQNRLIVDVDPLQFRRKWVQGWKADIQVVGKDAKVVATKSINAYKPPFARTEFDLKTIPVGEYDVVVRLNDESNKQVAQLKTAFSKPAAPVWVGSNVGVGDNVLKPWTPIVAKPESLGMWGREYSFGKNALPQQITSTQKPLLQAPLQLVVDGTSLPASPTAKNNSVTPSKVTRSGTSAAKGWNIDWTCDAAFDGILWYTVKVSPTANTSKTLQSLALEIPMRNDTSTLYVTSSAGMSGEAGATPANWNSSWGQGFWLGNEKMGLSWFSESDQNWSLADPKQALTFMRDAKATVARVNFVSKPLEVAKPITYRFGLLATPSRPMPQGWRGWQFSSGTRGTEINTDPEKPTHGLSWWMNWSPLISAPYDVLPKAKEVPAAIHKVGAKALPYNALTVINDQAKDFSYYRSEWLVHPIKAIGGEAGVDQQSWLVSPHSSYSEYMLYALRQNVRNEKWDGHYFDFDGGAVPDTNEFHGSGYINSSGERRPTYDILSYRDFHKRLWTMLQEELKTDEPIIMAHNSASVAPYIHSFANIWFDGEQFNFSPKVDDDYTKVVSRDTFRAEFLGTNFGSVVLFLPSLGELHQKWLTAPAGPEKEAATKHFQKAIDTLLLYPVTHGTLLYPAWLDMEYLRPFYESRQDLDMSTARFYGYWENADLVKLSQGGAAANKDVVASIYAQDNRFQLAIGNWTSETQNVTADLAMLKISPKLNVAQAKLKNRFKEGEATRKGNQVQLTVPPKSVRIIEIGP